MDGVASHLHMQTKTKASWLIAESDWQEKFSHGMRLIKRIQESTLKPLNKLLINDASMPDVHSIT